MYNIEMRHCTIYETKTKALVTEKLICVFVFSYAIADILLKWLCIMFVKLNYFQKRKTERKKEKRKKIYIK